MGAETRKPDKPLLRVVTADAESGGRTSVARVAEGWYVACTSSELRHAPRALTLLGVPLVLFRGEGGAPGALLDRCPHRNAPLSFGRVVDGTLECGYHGWRFDDGGRCRAIPGLCGEHDLSRRGVASFPCSEQDGLVWVYGAAGADPDSRPYRMPHLGERGYTTVRQQMDFEGSVHAVAENALDVPHTAFLHRGLFRGTGERHEIEVVVRRWHDRVEAEYRGEPRPGGLIGRLLAPGGGTVTHFDRFLLPSITEVEYRLGERSHLCLTAALTPMADFRTRLFATATFRLPIPGGLVAPLFVPLARRVLRQDAAVLARQTEVIDRFGGEHYSSTEARRPRPAHRTPAP